MFAMLTGRPPFDGESGGELIAAHLREAPPLASSRIPGVPAIVDQILQQCLSKSPRDRLSSMLELGEAIGGAEQVVSVSAAATRGPTTGSGEQRSAPALGGASASYPSSTTLGGASGQTGTPMPVRHRRRWIAGVVVGVVAIGCVVAFTGLRRDGVTGQRSVPAAAPGGDGAARMHEQPTPIDMMPATATAPVTAIVNSGTTVTVAHDAGVLDAPPVTDMLDAAPPPQNRVKADGSGPRLRGTRRDYASSTNSTAPVKIDRGD